MNGLIVRCEDDSRTYRVAAKAHKGYREKLLALSRRRSSFAEVLSTVVRGAGVAPTRHGSIVGWVRRSLFELRVTLLGEQHVGDSLTACASQEARTTRGYERALRARDWPPDVEEVLQGQLVELRADHAHVLGLRGAA